MFSCVVAGRLPLPPPQQIDATHAVFQLENAELINHLVVFMTGEQAFPEGYGATVHLMWPQQGTAAPHWQLLMTALSNAPRYPLMPLARRLGLIAPGAPPLPTLVAPGATNLQLTLQMQTERTMAEYSYSVDDALWGMRVLRTLTAPTMLQPGTLSAGGEVFVSVAEMSAGCTCVG